MIGREQLQNTCTHAALFLFYYNKFGSLTRVLEEFQMKIFIAIHILCDKT